MQKAHPLIWEALILTSSKRDKVRLRQTLITWGKNDGIFTVGGSIPGTGFAIEDFQPLHAKRAIENGRRSVIVFDI